LEEGGLDLYEVTDETFSSVDRSKPRKTQLG